MNRKAKIALFGGLIAVPISVFTITYFNKKIRYNKLFNMLSDVKGGGDLPGLMDNPETAQAFDIYYHQGATIPVTNYWKSPNNKVMKWRDDIYIAGHGKYVSWGTTEEQIEGAFRAMPDKVAVSQVADSYQRRYGLDLYADLLNELEDSEDVMARINDRVNALPNYSTY